MSINKLYKQLEEYVNTPTITNLEPYWEHVQAINDIYQEFSFYTLENLFEIHQILALKAESDSLTINDVYCGFALVKKLTKEFLNLEAYDVQLITALVLYEGRMAEMQTGEGKTLAALFPIYLKAINKKGIQVHTFNDYLAERDHLQFKPIFDFLELRSAHIREGLPFAKVQSALRSEICYGSSKQFIYHYLKLSLNENPLPLSAIRYNQVIVDEADAILLDEATNPFVIAGNTEDFEINFYKVSSLIKEVVDLEYFEYSRYKRNVFLSEEGIAFLEKQSNISNLYDPEHHNLLSAFNLSLHAHLLLQRDVDYIVRDDQILLVDEFTGRIVQDRKWRNGLQTAVEAKEECSIKSEGRILNSISIPQFYNQFTFKAAMTATAREAAVEIKDSYGLELVVIPPNIPSLRFDHPIRIFKNKRLKYIAIIEEIIREHQTGRPILIGTQHISESEFIYENLKYENISCQILNAKNDWDEAKVVADAGKFNSVVISTNMAGRGTDIKLGGEKRKDFEKIRKMGGLLVIGTNMHNSGRIDRQLIGRAGRQGEEGESKLFVSLEDGIFEQFQLQKALPRKFKNISEDEILDTEILKYMKHIQEVVEDQDNLLRTTINKYAEIQYYQSQLIANKRLEVQKKWKESPSLQEALLVTIDHSWAITISQLFEIKDGIHFISLGGQNPLRAYRTLAHQLYQESISLLESRISEFEMAYENGDMGKFKSLKLKRPSSTWTYTVSDKGFSGDLASFMRDSSNLVYQIDLTGLIALMVQYVGKRLGIKRKNR